VQCTQEPGKKVGKGCIEKSSLFIEGDETLDLQKRTRKKKKPRTIVKNRKTGNERRGANFQISSRPEERQERNLSRENSPNRSDGRTQKEIAGNSKKKGKVSGIPNSTEKRKV